MSVKDTLVDVFFKDGTHAAAELLRDMPIICAKREAECKRQRDRFAVKYDFDRQKGKFCAKCGNGYLYVKLGIDCKYKYAQLSAEVRNALDEKQEAIHLFEKALKRADMSDDAKRAFKAQYIFRHKTFINVKPIVIHKIVRPSYTSKYVNNAENMNAFLDACGNVISELAEEKVIADWQEWDEWYNGYDNDDDFTDNAEASHDDYMEETYFALGDRYAKAYSAEVKALTNIIANMPTEDVSKLGELCATSNYDTAEAILAGYKNVCVEYLKAKIDRVTAERDLAEFAPDRFNKTYDFDVLLDAMKNYEKGNR